MKIHIDIPLEQNKYKDAKRFLAPNILEKDFADACLQEIKQLDMPLMNHPSRRAVSYTHLTLPTTPYV